MRPGDRIITSGHGGMLPPGLAIGTVRHLDPVAAAGRALGSAELDARLRGLVVLASLPRVVLQEEGLKIGEGVVPSDLVTLEMLPAKRLGR